MWHFASPTHNVNISLTTLSNSVLKQFTCSCLYFENSNPSGCYYFIATKCLLREIFSNYNAKFFCVDVVSSKEVLTPWSFPLSFIAETTRNQLLISLIISLTRTTISLALHTRNCACRQPKVSSPSLYVFMDYSSSDIYRSQHFVASRDHHGIENLYTSWNNPRSTKCCFSTYVCF